MISTNHCECGVFSIVRELLQWNVAGIPAYHQVTDWDFDPDVSQKRREQFYEVFFPRFLWFFVVFMCEIYCLFKLHGYRGSKYLERIGQGIDGKHRERQYQNAARDEGRLQGLNLLAP